MDYLALVETTGVDGRSLLAAAAPNWRRPVPHCPDWDTADLVCHTGEIFAWMAAIVTTGERVSPGELDPAPDALSELAPWYSANLDRIIDILSDADPSTTVWTFSTLGDHRVAWWRRRLAVELALHRFDAQQAVTAHGGPPPAPLDAAVAAAGIDEFVREFLPGLLSQNSIDRPSGTLHLSFSDGARDKWLDLDRRGQPTRDDVDADTAIHGSASDVLLWMTNRHPQSLRVRGDHNVLTRWFNLRR